MNYSSNILRITLYFFITCIALTVLAACTKETKPADSDASTNEETETEQNLERDEEFSKLENEYDARLGVYALDTGNDQIITYNSEERFAYASTFKVLAAALLLKQNNIQDLEEIVTYKEEDLVTYSPVTEQNVGAGMTLLELSEAAIRKSDNTAANLMLEALGGPDRLKQALREMGDDITNPERYETELNDFTPGSNKDTSTPKAMATTLKHIVFDDFLPKDKRELLLNWMEGNATGDALIRAGQPEGWVVKDKSGAASYGTRNDIAVVYPPDREPIVIAIMSRRDTEDAEYDDELVAQAAKIALNALK
ncbi:class A beta-lactamase [Gracilibacillus kekensis]|uniref:Beta-lactamase n=1 Tax=Gracilibacillus kekensis TaxID=1027249 RepID=A0A1M7QR65_9BACI|nr:class A beta-lactamase [Gracilibacillus kekensis]SHN34086.1 beta-lactamase class A [Gracilibacillus kekensis]